MKSDQPTTYATFYSAENFQPEESMGYLMRQILSAVAQQVERQLAHADLTNAQWVPLLKLYTKQASTVAELARACHLDTGAMTRLLDRLEAKGLCQRVRSEEDRRVVNMVLTAAGTQAAAAIPGLLSSVQNAHLEGFTPEEFTTLKSFLRRILNNTQATSTDTPGDCDAV
jgi:DNA-binding MarR family transcriptional regulator